jgi:hypothetical protein
MPALYQKVPTIGKRAFSDFQPLEIPRIGKKQRGGKNLSDLQACPLARAGSSV